MTTPLQQAAQAVINQFIDDGWASTLMQELRKALDAELHVPEISFGNIVEPVAHFNMAINETVGCIAYEYEKHNLKSGTPLYLHPPQPQLRECWYESDELKVCRKCGQLHDKAIPPQKAKPKTMVDVQEMCIAALQRDERAKVGDSRFEGWYSELNQAGKGSKQIAREAYEAGLNEADAQQAKQVPMTDNEIAMIAQLTQSAEPGNDGYILPFTFARAIEAHHSINK